MGIRLQCRISWDKFKLHAGSNTQLVLAGAAHGMRKLGHVLSLSW